MNVTKMIDNLMDEIQKDGKLGTQFEKEPVKVIENIIGKDLPDDVVEKIINGVKAKVGMEKIGDALDMLDGALDKVDLDKVDLDKAGDIAKTLKKLF
ncbi:MAG: hypothetical protein IJ958_00880 [Agathobacter sp.]|nr:hypothetical protein [Agathobacter sp.]